MSKPTTAEKAVQTTPPHYKKTIGIVGYTQSNITKLNKFLVDAANETGLKNDQFIPDMVAIGVGFTGPKANDHLQNAAKFCVDFGCEIIAIAEGLGESSINATLKTELGHNVDVISLMQINSETELQTFAKRIIESAIDNQKSSTRPNITFREDGSNKSEIESNLAEDLQQMKQKITNQNATGGYTFLQQSDKKGQVNYTKYCLILGGAGPLASATQAEKLTEQGVPYIHLSINSAPGKHKFEVENGPSYITHYKNAFDAVSTLKAEEQPTNIIIPCNTAHKRIPEFCLPPLCEKIIDIRQAAIEETSRQNTTKAILLGTNATTGVGLKEGEKGIYEQFRAVQSGYSSPSSSLEKFITPDTAQQKKIMTAIFEVKAGLLSSAKQKIKEVVEKLRQNPEHSSLPVILACTELPLPFTHAELSEFKMIDPASSLASKAKDLCHSKTSDEIGPDQNPPQRTESPSASKLPTRSYSKETTL